MLKHSLQVLLLCCCTLTCSAADKLFDANTDVGETPKKGSFQFDSSSGEYRVTGGGANMWAATDAFQYVWTKISGDVTITADVHFEGSGAVAHRKAALMIRQNLEPGSAYADVAVHGDGLTSLQFRPTDNAITQEIRSDLKAPTRIRIERRGERFTMYAGNAGEELKPAGPATVALQDPVYIGLAVCSHDANVLETAVFSNVKIEKSAPQAAQRPRYGSKISVFDFTDKSTRVIYETEESFEAPNWSLDGRYLLANSGGRLYRIPLDGSAPQPLSVDSSLRCNNDHGISPDGKLLAFSAASPSSRQSQVYVADSDGSNAHMVVSAAPSYFHGWSPEGKWLAFVSQRDGNFDLFRISPKGGEEQRLTVNRGYDDGPDYSPRWQMDLLQFRPLRWLGYLAHAGGWSGAGR